MLTGVLAFTVFAISGSAARAVADFNKFLRLITKPPTNFCHQQAAFVVLNYYVWEWPLILFAG